MNRYPFIDIPSLLIGQVSETGSLRKLGVLDKTTLSVLYPQVRVLLLIRQPWLLPLTFSSTIGYDQMIFIDLPNDAERQQEIQMVSDLLCKSPT